jgi:hypothetical protein
VVILSESGQISYTSGENWILPVNVGRGQYFETIAICIVRIVLEGEGRGGEKRPSKTVIFNSRRQQNHFIKSSTSVAVVLYPEMLCVDEFISSVPC